MIDKIKQCIASNIGKGKLKVHFSTIDISIPTINGSNKPKYTVILGIFVDGDLVDSFELGDISNDEIMEYWETLKEFKQQKLYLL